MITNLRIEEGHIFEYEDIINLVNWKIPKLIVENLTFEEIIGFFDDEEWQRQAKIALSKFENNYY